MEVSGEDLLDILPAIDRIPEQVIETGSGRVGQVNGEELDHEKVIVHPAHPACEAVVL
jgi:hypothetical protein